MLELISSRELQSGSQDEDFVCVAQLRADQMYERGFENRHVTLGEAHRLLDPAALCDVLVTCVAMRCKERQLKFPLRRNSGEYAFPLYPVLLPFLHEWSWGWIADGKLIATGIEANDCVKGKRFAIPADRLHLLEPDFERACLLRDGKVVIVDVQVKRAPAAECEEPSKQRRHVSEADLKRCIQQIVSEWRERRPPGRERLDWIVTDRLGWVSRDRIRAARKNYAPPNWQITRGKPGERE